ncbi:MAG: TolC family protein [bacterium]|nr:TolC family protein [bacterium]
MRIVKHARLGLGLLLLVIASGVQADQHTEGVNLESEATTAETEAMATTEAETIALSLREAVNLAIENNLGVEIARHDPLISNEDLSVAWSAYDPTFTGDITYASQRSAVGAGTFDPAGISTTGSAAISGLVPYLGATLSVDYTGSRTKNAPATSRLSPKYESGLALSANIPLLKGLVWNDPWTQVKVAGLGHEAAVEDFRRIVMDTVRDAVSAYWNLVAAEEQLRVANKSLETGQALLEQTKTQYEVGVKSKVEVIQAEAGVAARELDVIRADATYRNSQDTLIDAISGIRLTASAQTQLRPTDNPSDFDDYSVDPRIAVEQAMSNRPELTSIKFEIERQETLVRFRKNQRLPQLDLNLTYGTSGLAGDGNSNYFGIVADDPLTPLVDEHAESIPRDTGGFSDTPDSWFKKRGAREYSVGGQISIPLGNYGPRHSVSKARLELRRAKTRLTQLHQQIILEVRRDIRLLEAARKGIDASERQRVAAEEQLRAERIRLEHGESTPFDVLQKESELVEAEVAKIEALQLYRTSASDLDRAQGTILRTHNVVVGSVSGLRNGMGAESFGVKDLLDPVLP